MRIKCSSTSLRFSFRGFTLVESLVALLLLGLMATSIIALYSASLQNVQSQRERMETDALMHGKMETLLATPFSALANGSSVHVVHGTNYELSWTIAEVDLDGDSNNEKDVREITVQIGTAGLGYRSLTTLRLKE